MNILRTETNVLSFMK